MIILTLIASTFRELFAKATLIVLAGISLLILVGIALLASVEQSAEGYVLKLFGGTATAPIPFEQVEQGVRVMQAAFAEGLFSGILLFGVLATAGVVPDLLEKGTIDLYLSKPIHRWTLLLGKYLGAIAAVMVNIIFFIGGLWLISGFRLGVWNHALLLSAVGLTAVFAGLYGVILLAGTVSRNTAVSVLVALFFAIVIANLLEYRADGLFRLSESPIYRGVLDGVHAVFPQVIAGKRVVAQQIMGAQMDWTPVVQCLLAGAGWYGVSALLFHRRDF